jgi:hypothetical protein
MSNQSEAASVSSKPIGSALKTHRITVGARNRIITVYHIKKALIIKGWITNKKYVRNYDSTTESCRYMIFTEMSVPL